MKATITIELEGTDEKDFSRIARDLSEGFFVMRHHHYPSVVWKHPKYPESIVSAKLVLDISNNGSTETTTYPLSHYIGNPLYEKRKDKYTHKKDRKND